MDTAAAVGRLAVQLVVCCASDCNETRAAGATRAGNEEVRDCFAAHTSYSDDLESNITTRHGKQLAPVPVGRAFDFASAPVPLRTGRRPLRAVCATLAHPGLFAPATCPWMLRGLPTRLRARWSGGEHPHGRERISSGPRAGWRGFTADLAWVRAPDGRNRRTDSSYTPAGLQRTSRK
jgi:hypothetical protein